MIILLQHHLSWLVCDHDCGNTFKRTPLTCVHSNFQITMSPESGVVRPGCSVEIVVSLVLVEVGKLRGIFPLDLEGNTWKGVSLFSFARGSITDSLLHYR